MFTWQDRAGFGRLRGGLGHFGLGLIRIRIRILYNNIILGEHFGTRRCHIDHSASTKFDLLVNYFPPSNTLIVHVYSFPRRTISLCSKTPPSHSLFKLDLIMARATTEVGTDPREFWSAFWASWRWNIFDLWFFVYELKKIFCPRDW